MTTGSCPQRWPWSAKSSVVVLLVLQSLLLGWSATRHSPTLDEPAQVAAGLRLWQHGRFDLYTVNPPLVRLLAGFPLLAAGARTDWSRLTEFEGERPEFPAGIDFVAVNEERSLWLFTLARWACLPIALLGGWFCYCWARDLFGTPAGLVALTFWTFSPSVLAHGQLITTDVAAASFGVMAGYAFWRWIKIPTWPRAVIAGLCLSLAELSKMTWLVLFALWPIIWLVWMVKSPDDGVSRPKNRVQLAQLLAVLAVGLYGLNLGYAFDGSCSRLKSFAFVSRSLSGMDAPDNERVKGVRGNRFAENWLGDVPIPLPREYVLGLDLQQYDFENPPMPSYLAGEMKERGWWHFYLVALAVKVPLSTWILTAAVIVWRMTSKLRPVSAADEFALLAPMLTVLIVVSSQTGFSHHMRYVIPVFPFLFVWLSQAAKLAAAKRIRTALAASLVVWTVAGSIWVYPHSLSYFNEAAGGPYGGPRYLINSDCDWGQDLMYLREWLEEHHGDQPLSLLYYGNFEPRDVGFRYDLPPIQDSGERATMTADSLPAGLYAVSLNFAYGLPRKAPDGRGGWVMLPEGAFRVFSRMTPIGRAGYSIGIYRIAGDGS